MQGALRLQEERADWLGLGQKPGLKAQRWGPLRGAAGSVTWGLPGPEMNMGH